MRLNRMLRKEIFRLMHRGKEQFECPICRYTGPFRDIHKGTGLRKHARCPQCGSNERVRLQYLVITDLLANRDFSEGSILHIAPESFFRRLLSPRFGEYRTCDLIKKKVDYNLDLQDLPFRSEVFDFVFASHVLEHVPDDRKALAEVRRILKPGGIAVLPVPIVGENTVEYPEANPNEFHHVRAPGMDYFDRYKGVFPRVDVFTSKDFPDRFQLYYHEDRSSYCRDLFPLRPTAEGDRHLEAVPVCYV